MKSNDFINLIKDFITEDISFPCEETLTRITADSREVEKGTVFFCLKGINSDGHKYIDMALEKGAAIVIGERDIERVNYLRVESVRKVLELVSPVFYDFPDNKMKMIGITGTNGKTSTALIIENTIKSKYNCGVIGTLGYKYSGLVFDAPNTTPQNWKWYSLLNEMVKSGVNIVVSEVSSHSLEEKRIENTLFDVAVFTNLTRDHLDFHKTVEKYYQAKKKLFSEHLKETGTIIINYDDFYGKRLYNELCTTKKIIRISMIEQKAEIFIEVVETGVNGSSININYEGRSRLIKIPLTGRHNIYNTVSAFAVSSIIAGVEYSFSAIEKRIVVPGRLEQVGTEPIFIDYAHTPDALENVLNTIRELNTFRKIITVFGAGGDRDRGKRPLMGSVASKLSDIVILTDDNPRTEEPEIIIGEILAGCNSENSVIEIINDRTKAIRKAIDMKEADDVILIAGKGAENYQITKEGKRFFSDKEEVEKYLLELQNVHNNFI